MDYIYVCKSLAQAIGSGVRLYQNEKLLIYTSLLDISPDPVLPYIEEILCYSGQTGIYITPLFQFYAYFDTADGSRMIIGPSGMPADDTTQLEALLVSLNIPASEKGAYVQKLRCAPSIPLERVVSLLGFLVATVNHASFSTENLFMNYKVEQHQHEIAKSSASSALENVDDNDSAEIVRGSYAYEKMLLCYVQNGQAEELREMLDSGIGMKPGNMAKDVLRQVKNAGICGATIASRAAIAGGMDSTTAFGLSDLYIQKLEILREYSSIMRLTNDMFVDFAQRVQLVQYGETASSSFFKSCARYIAAHITEPLSTGDLAQALHISSSYLCMRFKNETGMTLSQYIQQEKITEAKRLLSHTEKNLSEIAVHLSYSSQSHFQNAFKKITNQTPMQYRRENS